MTLLTHEAQEKVVALLISEGLVSREKVQEVVEEVAKTKQPLLATLTARKITDAETITHATAVVMNVPYVSLNGGTSRGEEWTALCGDAGCVKRAADRLSFTADPEADSDYDGFGRGD